MLSLILFITGLIIGSFLNSLLYRIDQKKSFKGRSYCPKCKKQITWHDNIPLISYLLLGGKCRKCKKPISIQYPAVELLTAITFVLMGLFSAPGIAIADWLKIIFNEYLTKSLQFPMMALFSLVLLLASCFLLLAVAIYDAKTKYVLTYYVYAAIFFAVLYSLAEYYRLNGRVEATTLLEDFVPYILVAIIPAGIFWLVSRISKEKIMGSGDADIALAIGFLVGWPKILPAYYFAFIVGAMWGTYLLATKKAKMKSEVPFGPFLIAGAFFGLIFGEQIISWYGKMFLGM